MKLLPKVIRSIWLFAMLAVFDFAFANAACEMPVSRIAYNGHGALNIAYDRSSESAFNYDFRLFSSANERENQSARTIGNFAHLAEFLATDALGLTDTSQLQGSEYTDSLILANVARSSLLTAATFGTAALAQGGSQAALYSYQGLQIYNAGSSGYSIGTGINQVANGNNWGYLNIAGGTLGVVGSTTFAAGNPTLNSLAGVGPSSGGFAQSAVTWWNTGSEGDAAFQNLSFGQQLQSEIGQNAVSGTSTSGTYAQIGGDSATALQKGANILQSGNPMNIFGLNLPQTFNLLGTGPTAGVRLYVPPAAFIGAGAINAVNTATSP
jgi:hypothetical protein